MERRKVKKDHHFPTFLLDNIFRRLVSSPRKYNPHIKADQVVADLGSGPGYFTLAMAQEVGPEGKVYAVDSDEKSIQAVEKKADKKHLHNIEAHASSAASLEFIEDQSVDFVLADGLIC